MAPCCGRGGSHHHPFHGDKKALRFPYKVLPLSVCDLSTSWVPFVGLKVVGHRHWNDVDSLLSSSQHNSLQHPHPTYTRLSLLDSRHPCFSSHMSTGLSPTIMSGKGPAKKLGSSGGGAASSSGTSSTVTDPSAPPPTKTRDAWYTFNEAKLEEICTQKAWLQE